MSDNFTSITVPDAEPVGRLDRYLRAVIPTVKQSEIERLFRKKFIRLNGGRAAADMRVSPGDEITVPNFLFSNQSLVDNSQERGNQAVATDIQADQAFLRSITLYENEDFLVFNKPSGLPVQGGSGSFDHLDRALESLRNKKNFRPSLAHRLDKDTSGCLLVAKKRAAAVYAGEQFRSRVVHKYYLAVVQGSFDFASGVLDKPMTKLSGARGFETVRCVRLKEEGALPAYSFYYRLAHSETRTLLMLQPFTGRTHQLRVHLSDAGFPIVGDGKYGYRERRDTLHLHAWRLDFPLPKKDGREELMLVKAPLPEHMKATLEREGMEIDGKTLDSAKEMLDIVAEREIKRLNLSAVENLIEKDVKKSVAPKRKR